MFKAKRRSNKKKIQTRSDIESDSDREYDSETSQGSSVISLKAERQARRLKQAKSLTRRGPVAHKYELRKAFTRGFTQAVRQEIRQLRLEEARSEEHDEERSLQIIISDQENSATSTNQQE